jgi:hypothetical protein
MKREDIEKAARVWAEDEITKSRKERGIKAFKAGANWRINSVWHDASENPKLNKFFVFENKCNEWETDCLYQHQKWNLYVAVNDLIRWAYIEDLLPNTEE